MEKGTGEDSHGIHINGGSMTVEGGTVTSRLSRADYDTAQSQQFVEESFSGSLPAFITAFTRRKKLTEDEIAELQKLIDQNRR